MSTSLTYARSSETGVSRDIDPSEQHQNPQPPLGDMDSTQREDLTFEELFLSKKIEHLGSGLVVAHDCCMLLALPTEPAEQ